MGMEKSACALIEVNLAAIAIHDELYIKARDSFYRSKEWKNFRQAFLERYPLCQRCGKQAVHVHHIEGFEIDSTILRDGFLKPLEDWKRFEAICGECHFMQHEELIKYEKQLKIGKVSKA